MNKTSLKIFVGISMLGLSSFTQTIAAPGTLGEKPAQEDHSLTTQQDYVFPKPLVSQGNENPWLMENEKTTPPQNMGYYSPYMQGNPWAPTTNYQPQSAEKNPYTDEISPIPSPPPVPPIPPIPQSPYANGMGGGFPYGPVTPLSEPFQGYPHYLYNDANPAIYAPRIDNGIWPGSNFWPGSKNSNSMFPFMPW